MMEQQKPYDASRMTDIRREGRWGAWNVEVGRWLDMHFGSQQEAERAAAFLEGTNASGAFAELTVFESVKHPLNSWRVLAPIAPAIWRTAAC